MRRRESHWLSRQRHAEHGASQWLALESRDDDETEETHEQPLDDAIVRIDVSHRLSSPGRDDSTSAAQQVRKPCPRPGPRMSALTAEGVCGQLKDAATQQGQFSLSGRPVIEVAVPIHAQSSARALFVAGDPDRIEEWRPLLQCIPGADSAAAADVELIHCGVTSGAAAAAQLCAAHQMAIQMIGLAETTSLARQLGLPEGALASLLLQVRAAGNAQCYPPTRAITQP